MKYIIVCFISLFCLKVFSGEVREYPDAIYSPQTSRPSEKDVARQKMQLQLNLKECKYQPGYSISCPEGTYKFMGSQFEKSVNDVERNLIKKNYGSNQPVPNVRTGGVPK